MKIYCVKEERNIPNYFLMLKNLTLKNGNLGRFGFKEKGVFKMDFRFERPSLQLDCLDFADYHNNLHCLSKKVKKCKCRNCSDEPFRFLKDFKRHEKRRKQRRNFIVQKKICLEAYTGNLVYLATLKEIKKIAHELFVYYSRMNTRALPFNSIRYERKNRNIHRMAIHIYIGRKNINSLCTFGNDYLDFSYDSDDTDNNDFKQDNILYSLSDYDRDEKELFNSNDKWDLTYF